MRAVIKAVTSPFLAMAGTGLVYAVALPVAPVAQAQEIGQGLDARISTMERTLQALEEDLKKARAEAAAAKQAAEAATQAAQTAKETAKGVQKTARKAIKAARAEDNSTIKWQFGGFGTGDFTVSSGPGQTSTFEGGSFNPIFLVSYKDLLFWESELEVSKRPDVSTKLELEFANINLNATDWLTVTFGQFLSPIGDFQQHLHPSWINKLPDRPAGFVEDGGLEPLQDVGLQLHGAFPIGSTTLEYAAYVGNGPQIAAEGINHEAAGSDDNNDKAVGGRIGFRPLPYLTIGLSGMRSRITGLAVTGGVSTSSDFELGGADFAFTKGPWAVRGEYLISHLDKLSSALEATDAAPTAIPSTIWRAGYLQASYRLSGLTDNWLVGNFEPVLRFSKFTVTGFDGFKDLEEERYTAGLDYWFAPSVVAKLALERRNFDNTSNETVGRFQVGFGF